MANGNQNKSVLIIVNSDIKAGIQDSLDQYISDLEEIEGYAVIVYENTKNTPVELRTYIKDKYDSLLSSSNPLAGCVLIGELPVPWRGPGDRYPLDSFYMDLHGSWGIDNKGKIVSIPYPIIPEIWIGRLTAGPLNGDEATLLNNYFIKNHKYRTRQWEVVDRAMAYVDNQWIPKGDYGLSSAYGNNVTLINDMTTTDADDYKNKLVEDYELLHVAVHSTAIEHTFKNNDRGLEGVVTYTDILNIKPQPVFYCFDACKVALYTEDNYSGGCYIFSGGRGLAAIGETQNAISMDGPSIFYSFFGGGLSFGESFIKWLNDGRANYHKDRTILGDPTLKRQVYYTYIPPDDETPPAAPVNLKIMGT